MTMLEYEGEKELASTSLKLYLPYLPSLPALPPILSTTSTLHPAPSTPPNFTFSPDPFIQNQQRFGLVGSFGNGSTTHRKSGTPTSLTSSTSRTTPRNADLDSTGGGVGHTRPYVSTSITSMAKSVFSSAGARDTYTTTDSFHTSSRTSALASPSFRDASSPSRRSPSKSSFGSSLPSFRKHQVESSPLTPSPSSSTPRTSSPRIETKMSDYKLSQAYRTSGSPKDSPSSFFTAATHRSSASSLNTRRDSGSPTSTLSTRGRHQSSTPDVAKAYGNVGNTTPTSPSRRQSSFTSDVMTLLRPRPRTPSAPASASASRRSSTTASPTSSTKSPSPRVPGTALSATAALPPSAAEAVAASPYIKASSAASGAGTPRTRRRSLQGEGDAVVPARKTGGSRESLSGKGGRRELHPEVETLLQVAIPKRTESLRYRLQRQPNSPRGLVGLANLGNTCFMNSILQCIFSCELLAGYFLSGDYKSHINFKSPLKGQLATAFAEAMKEIMKVVGDNGKVYNPSNLKKYVQYWAPQFAGYDQQDAQEFLRFMLDGLHEDLNRVSSRPKFTYKDTDVDVLTDVEKARFSWARYHAASSSLIFDIFGGQLQSTVTCLSCGQLSTTFDTFWDLSLPIPKNRSRGSDKECNILDCLREFAMEEVLEELYKCAGCKSNQKASKSLRLYRCPEVLVLHLKRFSYTMYSREKIETRVVFPLDQLSLESIMSATPGNFASFNFQVQTLTTDPFHSDVAGHDNVVTYELFGVSNHMGGLGGGHYIAHCKNPDDGKWYQRNDSKVMRCSEAGLISMEASAYVLFFQKKRAAG
ncbi:Ubiquitin carboxyl-terminal hydrolase 21 [Phlyctochytrium bullatum]|nr:Ubiquitin carboxyl-terminal hydrolase 21 [Phlyctochytrium bullatum]